MSECILLFDINVVMSDLTNLVSLVLFLKGMLLQEMIDAYALNTKCTLLLLGSNPEHVSRHLYC